MTAATSSKAKAAAKYRSQNFQRAIQRGMITTTMMDSSSNNTPSSSSWNLSQSQQTALILAERDFLEKGKKVTAALQMLQTRLMQWAIDEQLFYKFDGMTPNELDPPAIEVDSHDTSSNVENHNDTKSTTVTANATASSSSSSTKTHSSSSSKKEREHDKRENELLQKAWTKQQHILLRLELDFVQRVIEILGPERATGIRTALLGNGGAVGSLLLQLEERPLRTLLFPEVIPTTTPLNDENTTSSSDDASSSSPSLSSSEPKRLYVTYFDGDVTASQVAFLREEVTAILQNGRPGLDEALVVLQTGGGTVTGYGLAAAQLVRLRNHGIHLTIAAEQVAASGGYMMCCVADHIVASPFCVLGSIGVISDIPNVYERLKQEGIEFQTVTAGKYKRTLTPTKKFAKEDADKAKQDLEAVLSLFRNFVKTYRPQLDIEQVATGETWFGTDALERGLCDEIKPVDDVLLDFIERGYNVYELEYSPPEPGFELGRLLPVGGSANSGKTTRSNDGGGGILTSIIRWLVTIIAAEVRAEVQGINRGGVDLDDTKRKYMLMDDSSNRIRTKF